MKKTALTVDDSKTMREMVAFTLEGAGYDVIKACDGVDALNVLDGKSVDLIITDVNMPNMDGLTLVKELRARSEFRAVPILILTTEGGSDMKQRGRDAGATGWIVKPFEPEKFINTVAKVCP